jgi:hypothetical protein
MFASGCTGHPLAQPVPSPVVNVTASGETTWDAALGVLQNRQDLVASIDRKEGRITTAIMRVPSNEAELYADCGGGSPTHVDYTVSVRGDSARSTVGVVTEWGRDTGVGVKICSTKGFYERQIANAIKHRAEDPRTAF